MTSKPVPDHLQATFLGCLNAKPACECVNECPAQVAIAAALLACFCTRGTNTKDALDLAQAAEWLAEQLHSNVYRVSIDSVLRAGRDLGIDITERRGSPRLRVSIGRNWHRAPNAQRQIEAGRRGS